MLMLADNNDVFQYRAVPHPVVPVAMYLFGLNFQIEL